MLHRKIQHLDQKVKKGHEPKNAGTVASKAGKARKPLSGFPRVYRENESLQTPWFQLVLDLWLPEL